MELNLKQIIKALECCKSPLTSDCATCAYKGKSIKNGIYVGCVNTLIADALAIIKELTEENESLRAACDKDISFVRVCRGSGKTEHLREVARIRMDAVRADTVRKMQTMFAMRFGTYTDNDVTPIKEVFRLMDKFAKEMLEGK